VRATVIAPFRNNPTYLLIFILSTSATAEKKNQQCKEEWTGVDLFPEQRVVEHVVLGGVEVAFEDDRLSGVQHVDLTV